MELEDLMSESIDLLEKDFYSKSFQFSYSSLNKLMWNPQVFYQMYILGNREEKTDSHLINGKVVHCLLLEEAKFNEQFIISQTKLPSENTKSVIDRVFGHYEELTKNGDPRQHLTEFTQAILDVLKDMNLHQSLKTDQQRVDKIVSIDTIEYWEFLKNRNGKILIDQATYDFCKTSVELIKLNKNICTLLGCNTTEFDGKIVLNEYPLDCKVNGKHFGLKGIIDNIVIDNTQKIVYINDVKTSSKELKDFPDSIEFYSYWMQAAIYTSLVAVNFADLLDEGYTIKFNFVVIDKNYQCYAFPVSESTLNSWLERTEKVLEKAEWHYINKSYDLPYDFALGKITL